MAHPIEILPVDIALDSAEITRLLRRSFRGIAETMGITAENCPHFVAFITEERLLDQLGRDDAYCLGIRQDGAWVGFVAVAPYGDAYEVTRLAVAPEYRHRGYGGALMAAACDTARKIGLREIGLGLINENTILKAWYEEQGIRPR